jgi:YD repeat-containing protein
LPPGAPAASAPPRSGDLVCVTDNFGRQLHFQYNTQRRVERSIEPDGGINTYRYDGPTAVVLTAPAGNLTSITYPDGTGRVFHYNEQANTGNVNRPTFLTGTSDDLGGGVLVRTGTYQYSGTFGVSTAGADGVNRYGFSYTNFGAPGQKTTVVDPLGTPRTLSYTQIGSAVRLTGTSQPPGAGCGPSVSGITYDANANVASRTDFNGVKTCYAYDLTRNLETRRIEGVGASTDCATALSSPPTGSRVISTQWHPDWRFETRIAEPNKITTLTYNGQGATCAPSTVLVDGKLPAVVCSRSEQATTDATGALGFGAGLTGTARTWSYTYATYGRVLTATDPNGKLTTTTHYPDDDPDLGRRGNVATITNAANHVTRITAYNLHEQPTQIVDPNMLVTDLTYDMRMRLKSRKVGNEITTFDHTPTGQLWKVTLPDGAGLTYTYDAAHRLTAITDQQNNRIDYTLDAMGNRVTERTTDNGGTLVKNIQRTIDALNRVQQVVGAE